MLQTDFRGEAALQARPKGRVIFSDIFMMVPPKLSDIFGRDILK